MGDCRYCGKSAGFLRKEHKACAASHERGLESIRKVCVDAALYGVDVDRLTDSVRSIGASSFIDTSGAAMTATLAEGWGQAVKAAMDDHFLSNEEKPEVFRMGETDAWFLVNIIDAVMSMDSVKLPKAGDPTLDEIVDGGLA